MDEARTYAWIMYALAGASQTTPANIAAVSQIADGINHAVPTSKEMQSSLKWLIENGLAQKQGSAYFLTDKGNTVMASARTGHNTISQVWASLTTTLITWPGKL